MKCPRCNEEIDYLIFEHIQRFHYNPQIGTMNYKESKRKFYCPNCGEEINEEEVKKMLKELVSQ